ncbi:MAG: aminotransferase class I/II-fold pyridoxal phosphate-dependent enzyme [Anaerolineae bacterium]|jgi:DNA-binding transcriptional MocR family regulator
MDFRTTSSRELREYKAGLLARYQAAQARNLVIDMTRGKPSPEQLDLSMELLQTVNSDHYRASNGVDCRNYGGLDGIPEAKDLFSQYLGVEPQEIIIGGNSSLNMMYDAMVRAMLYGVVDSEVPWGTLPRVQWLCPSPGYDRHFSVCEHLGIEMLPIEMGPDGPDMAEVERLAAGDETVKGIWCVPKYSNPTGVVYSDEVVERLARMRTAAADFCIFWDNAYAVHHLDGTIAPLKNILAACKAAGNPNRVLLFGSTSKISFAASGVAMMGGSEATIELAKRHMSYQTIGPDKLNQLRHVRFFGDLAGIEAHMRKHAAILRPKFDAVLEVLERELAGKNIATWSRPAGGYFISLDTLDGCAKAVVAMAAEAGVKLTAAGATFPYKCDPRDRNIRLAPSLPSTEDIRSAMEVVAICIQLVSLDKVLATG